MDEDVRRELDQLHVTDRDLRQAISDLDNHGSRGVLQLTAQVTDLIKDITEVKLSFVAHEVQHEKEAADRRNSRRWMAGFVVAGLSGFAAVIGLLVEVLQRVHG
jgi:hypothetical protein